MENTDRKKKLIWIFGGILSVIIFLVVLFIPKKKEINNDNSDDDKHLNRINELNNSLENERNNHKITLKELNSENLKLKKELKDAKNNGSSSEGGKGSPKQSNTKGQGATSGDNEGEDAGDPLGEFDRIDLVQSLTGDFEQLYATDRN